MPGTLFVVATPIGNLEDVTARALRVLREVSVIAAEDTRRTAHLLAHYAIATRSTSLHEHNESRKTPALIERLKRGESIALVSDAGTPLVSDPGQRLVEAAIAAGIRVEPVPGPSAVLAALAASGFPSDTFTFLGFPPVRSKDRNSWLERLRTAGQTVVFFEAPHRIAQTMQDILRTAGDVRVCVARELTKVHEQLVVGPISTVLDRLHDARGEFTVVVNIGDMTELALPERPGDVELAREFCGMTNSTHATRRQAISALARKYGLASREVYAAIERGRKLVK